jgi:16S rRNA processing protein RimM
MIKDDCYHLGYVAKLHGFKGEVSLFLDVTNPDEYKKLEYVYIDINGLLTPFFITTYQLKAKGFASVKFEGIDTENDAKTLQRKDLYLPLSTLPELSGINFYDHEIIDFELIDLTFGRVGKIVQIIDLPANPLIQVDADGKEIFIPFVKDLVQELDRINKKMIVKTPKGLLAIYL